MKRNVFTIIIVALLIVTACDLSSGLGFRTVKGSGEVITESREVSEFVQVDVCCGMELHITQGESESLIIEADNNFMPEIVTRLADGRLIINYQDTANVSYQPSQPVILYLSVVDIQEVSISGGGRLVAESLTSDKFDLELSGGSDAEIGVLAVDIIDINISGGGDIVIGSVEAENIHLELSGSSDADIEDLFAETLTLDISGGGSAKFTGTVVKSEIDLSGGSSIEGQDFKNQDTTISCSSGGSSTIWVEEKLDTNLSGGCSLKYYGQPEILAQSLSGGSDLISLGER